MVLCCDNGTGKDGHELLGSGGRMSNLLKVLTIFLSTSIPAFALPILDIEKTTNGPTNANPTAPTYDNEDAAGGPGVPILTQGSTVTWTYKVTNTGTVSFDFDQLGIVDDNGTPGATADDFSKASGQITFQSVFAGNADNILQPGESWLFNATGTVQNGVYENTATLTAPGAQGDSDRSHYTTANIDIEKTTNGPTNANPTAPDYDNEDTAGGPGVPILTPGSTVTWTYKVTNTGSLPFDFNLVVIVDDDGTPANTADDFLTAFLNVQTGDADNVLEPGEVWLYGATGIVQNAGVYGNKATVSAPGALGDSDLSHYTNVGTAVPEPGTLGLFAIGFPAVLALRRKHKIGRLLAQ
jgi:hypothetical protein